MIELQISEAAERDYAEALHWYAERSAFAAMHFEREIDTALQKILPDPSRFAQYDGSHRTVLVSRYPFQIFFRIVSANLVLVVAIAHTSRRPNYWQRP